MLPLSICKVDDAHTVQMGSGPIERAARYTVEADQLFPFMLYQVANGDVSIKDKENKAEYERLLNHWRRMLRENPSLSTDAISPGSLFTDPAPSTVLRRKLRADYLEFLRKWFTAELKDTLEQEAIGNLTGDDAAEARDSVKMVLYIRGAYVKCENCDGTGSHTVGNTSPKEVPCGVCEGRKVVKVESPWKL